MPYVRIRSEVDLPDLPRGTVARLVPDARIRGLLRRGLLTDLDAAELVVPSGTVRYLLDWVGDDDNRARAVLDAELARDRPRQTLVAALAALDAAGAPEDAAEGEDTGGAVDGHTGDLTAPSADTDPAG